jgi:octaprenyl-diphosphate synthase
MCQGELSQNLQKNNWQLSENQYIEIIAEKTAAIFQSCCELGARLGGADDGLARKFGDYGFHFGIAFQIVDDVLDIIGDEEKAGKTLGTDLSATKLTLPLIHLLENIDGDSREEMIESLSRAGRDCHDTLSAMLTDNGCIEYSRDCVRRHAGRAIESLESVADSEAKAALINTAKFVVSRIEQFK